MTDFLLDLRYALRQLRKSPGFTLTAVLVLGLGIGANTAMFTVLNAVLLRPLPYANVNRLVIPEAFDKQGRPMYGAMYPDINEWKQRSYTLSGIAYSTDLKQFFEISGSGESLSNVESSASLFSVLGVQPQIGRAYQLAEQEPGRDHVVVLSDKVWEKYFHRDPNALGKTIKLDGKPYTVIGVMPKTFSYPFSPTDAQAWTPLPLTPDAMTRSGPVGYYGIIGRVKPGVSLSAAQTELNSLQHAIAKEYPAGYGYSIPVSVQVQSYRASLTGQFRPALLILEAACLILWLIACANVAGLLLVRGSVRQREVAVRAALGAGRAQIIVAFSNGQPAAKSGGNRGWHWLWDRSFACLSPRTAAKGGYYSGHSPEFSCVAYFGCVFYRHRGCLRGGACPAGDKGSGSSGAATRRDAQQHGSETEALT